MKLTKMKKISTLIIFIISCVLFLSYLHPTFNLDEEYTMGLIQHSFKNVIDINMLDVHPPTYYVLLKAFLNITTFWTSSFMTKIMFARLFSLIFFILNFIILHKLVKLLKLNINWKLQFIFYLLLEYVSYNSVNIRPYALFCCLDALTFYELVKFNKYNENYYLILATISAILASYIDYLSAVCVGLFLLIFFIKYLINKNIKDSVKLLFSGVIYLLMNIPLILILIKQASNRQKYPSFGFGLSSLLDTFTQTGIGKLIIVVPMSICFIAPIIYSFQHLNTYFNDGIKIVLLNYLILLIITLLVCIKIHTFESKLLYPTFSIYSFLIISIILNIFSIKTVANKFNKLVSILCIIFIALLSCAKIYKNIKGHIIPIPQIVRTEHKYSQLSSTNIHFTTKNIPTYIKNNDINEDLYICQLSTSLKFHHKNLIINKKLQNNLSHNLLNNNKQLLKKNFNNIYIK